MSKQSPQSTKKELQSGNISIISWNLNGLSSNINKGTLIELIQKEKPDILCLQEIKCQDKKLSQIVETLKEIYPHIYYNCAKKKGYSGTMILSKIIPNSVSYGMRKEIHDTEGRLITAEFDKYILVTCYTPNSKGKLERLPYRTQEWEPDLREYLSKLNKPIIYCGDLNVAHQEIDLANPTRNKKKAGFTMEERQEFTKMLEDNKMVDTFRYLNPKKDKSYTFWSNFAKSRERNVGWRIDYFLVSSNWITNGWLVDSQILEKYMGSDHAPIRLISNLK